MFSPTRVEENPTGRLHAGGTRGDRCEANAGRALSSREIDFPAEVGRDLLGPGCEG
jgi:hypothetical protein